jgi:hypothetical protein
MSSETSFFALVPSFVKNKALTCVVRAWSFWNVPLLYSMKPKVINLNDNECTVCIPLRRKTKNHVQSLYLGALAGGADAAAGLLGGFHIHKSKQSIRFLFKDMNAEFFKRAEGDTYFYCTDGQKIKALVEKSQQTQKNQKDTVTVHAKCPKISDDIVASFRMTISLKMNPLKK